MLINNKFGQKLIGIGLGHSNVFELKKTKVRISKTRSGLLVGNT